MSRRQAVVLAVVVEGLSQAEAGRRYEVSESTVSRWVARWRVDGEAAFEPRSRRPKSSPTRVAPEVAERIVNLRVKLTAAT
jgi:transposase